jgi:hypothetical protein
VAIRIHGEAPQILALKVVSMLLSLLRDGISHSPSRGSELNIIGRPADVIARTIELNCGECAPDANLY